MRINSKRSKAIGKEQCPRCFEKGGDNSGDNLAIYDDGHKHCYACGYNYQPLSDGTDWDRKEDLLVYTNGKVHYTHTSSLDCGIVDKDNGIRNKGIMDSINDSICTYEHLPWRGVTENTFRYYKTLTKIDDTGKPLEIGFPYPNGSVKVRSLEKKSFYTKGDIGKAGLFGRNLFAAGSNKTLIITEGELDALSLWQTVHVPVVSVHSASSARTDVGIDRSWCNSFERIVLAFDADDAGREAARQVAAMFDYNKVYSLSYSGQRKDANDYVRHGESDELATIYQNAKRYLPSTIVSSFSEFDKILKEKPKEGIPYPFPTLSFMTYGIRTGESVLVTAQEGVGKTEVMRAIEHQLLRETNDPVGVIFLEEPKQRHLLSLAGLHLRRPAHLPDSGVTEAEASRAVQDVVGTDDRLHLYSHFGSDDPDTILDTIRFLVAGRGCRYVLLDHITMVVSGLGGTDERQALDYLSTRLEMMVKELDFSLIVVSHVNDDGKTRGSRNISKIADIRIDLDRDITNPDPTIRRIIDVKISKNRFCGRTGPAGSLLFDPLTNTLSEELGYGEAQRPIADNDNRRLSWVA